MLPDKNTIRLLRIPFSVFLMPLFLFAVSQAESIHWVDTVASFLIIHLLVYPASNGYNSYMDRDEESVGGLERPPMPTKALFYLTLAMDLTAIVLASFIGLLFAGCLVAYIIASRAYSARGIRLKKYPFAGFLTVVLFQGAFTYYMASVGISGGAPMQMSRTTLWILLGCSFQIAGAYPLTQIYQHQQDLRDGVVTISYKLGYLGTFLFSGLMFLICNVWYFLYFSSIGHGTIFFVLQLFFLPIVVYFGFWFSWVRRDQGEASFQNTMRMNRIAGWCMNSCFLVLIFIRYTPLSYLTDIETAVPGHGFTQETLTQFYSASASDELTKRKIRIVASRSGIGKRYSVIDDFGKNPSQFSFFSKTALLIPEPGLTARMALYQQHATALSEKVVRQLGNFDELKSEITHLITVTCTGLFAPGLDVELIRNLGLNPSVNRSSVNFMGCNAAIIALRQADAICRAEGSARVLVVCTELCTLHFQRQFNDDYILSNLLFGDGAAAVVVSSMPSVTDKYQVKIDRFDSHILHQGYTDMAWRLSETGFIMSLSSYVPDLISGNIGLMLRSAGVDSAEVSQWAIHPGGKRILDDFASALNLGRSALTSSYRVLEEYGNMSSPTVLFVLKDLLGIQGRSKPEGKCIAAAFGPGLSIETMQFHYA